MKRALLLITVLLLLACSANDLSAQQGQTIPLPKIGLDIGTSDSPEDVSATIQILLLMTVLSLAPSILIMTTSYLRLIIVFHFLKQALGTQQMPPNQLMAGIGLFITFFIMAPTWTQVNDTALQPLMKGEMNISQAYDIGIEPIREFMFAHVRDEDLELFISLSQDTRPETRQDLPTYILLPAFALSELRAGFLIGFFLFIPFLMVDMIVGSILLSMGMMMIPPMMVALPFKILLFVLVDGWNLVIGSVMRSFT
ncbi:MAG: flagellar type III secretion system pore protein FliP [Bacteroidetes bacterium]|nr:flagellar type III secretion system pore protein FliP [Bacteroidota bacterium]